MLYILNTLKFVDFLLYHNWLYFRLYKNWLPTIYFLIKWSTKHYLYFFKNMIFSLKNDNFNLWSMIESMNFNHMIKYHVFILNCKFLLIIIIVFETWKFSATKRFKNKSCVVLLKRSDLLLIFNLKIKFPKTFSFSVIFR